MHHIHNGKISERYTVIVLGMLFHVSLIAWKLHRDDVSGVDLTYGFHSIDYDSR